MSSDVIKVSWAAENPPGKKVGSDGRQANIRFMSEGFRGQRSPFEIEIDRYAALTAFEYELILSGRRDSYAFGLGILGNLPGRRMTVPNRRKSYINIPKSNSVISITQGTAIQDCLCDTSQG